MHGLLCSGRWGPEKMAAYRLERLRSLIRHASQRIPFFRERLGRCGVDANDIRDLADLRRLPSTTRRDLQDYGEENMRACGLGPEDLTMHLTSGSTGEPLRVWRTKNEDRLLAAFRLRALLRFGVHPGDKLASVQFLPEKARPIRKQHLLLRPLFPHVEIYCLLEIGDILERLNAYRPNVLAGLPPSLDRICDELDKGRWPGIQPRRIVSGAELLTSAIRTRLMRKFGVPVFDRYSAIECRLIAASCPRYPERFHICEDAVLIEVEKNGHPAGPGEEGEILVTALHSYAMPFIRYRLGDRVRLAEGPCPCGSPQAALAAVRGRLVDRLVRADGSQTHVPQVIDLLQVLAPWILRYRIVQRVPGFITIKVLNGSDPGSGAAAAVLRRLEEKVGGIEAAFDFHSDPLTEETGKFRLFESEIPGMQAETS